MKNRFLKTTILALTIITIGLISCKKSETEVLPGSDAQLVKITSWNPSTNTENASLELTYDASGKVKTAVSARVNLNVTYNANGKVNLIKGLNSAGGEVSYTLTYNTAGQLTQVVYLFLNPQDYGYTKTFEYNASGKVSKTTQVNTFGTGSAANVIEYTWNGDNIASSKTTNGAVTYTYTYLNYDSKINPYSLGDGIAAIIGGGPASKNNYTEISYVNGGITSNQKRTYEYNAAGYATSMKLADGSNEGTKFYYNK